MSLKDLFLIYGKNDYEKELKGKIRRLEMNIEDLKKTVASLKTAEKAETNPTGKDPPIIIEKVNIEKIIFDKYELNNNLGQLGIKELKGKLNIGATYGNEFIPKVDGTGKNTKSENSKNYSLKKRETTKSENTLKVNIVSKKENAKD